MRSLLAGLVVALTGCVTHEKEVVEKPVAQPVEVVTPPPPPAKVIVVPNSN